MAFKTSCRMGILCRAKSFLGTPELLITNKAFVRSLMEYCSPLWAGAPASHLPRLHAVETKAFRFIGISRDDAESLGLSLSHHRQVDGLSVFYCLLSSLAPPLCSVCVLYPLYFRRVLKVRQQPPSGKTTKVTNHCSPSLFHSSFSPPLEHTPTLSSIPLFPPGLKNSCSPPPLIIPIQILDLFYPVNPSQTHLLQIPCFPS